MEKWNCSTQSKILNAHPYCFAFLYPTFQGLKPIILLFLFRFTRPIHCEEAPKLSFSKFAWLETIFSLFFFHHQRYFPGKDIIYCLSHQQFPLLGHTHSLPWHVSLRVWGWPEVGAAERGGAGEWLLPTQACGGLDRLGRHWLFGANPEAVTEL